MSWREWFRQKQVKETLGFHDGSEELRYQAFKARLIEELKVESPELLNPAELVDRGES